MYNEDDDTRVADDHDNNESNVTTSTDSTGSVIVQQNPVFYQHPPGNVVVNNPAIIPYPQGLPPGQAPVNGVMHDEMLKNMSTQTAVASQPIIQPAIITQIPIAPAAAALPMPVEPIAVVSPDLVNQATSENQFEADIGKFEFIQSGSSHTKMLDHTDDESDKDKDDVIEAPTAPAATALPAAPKNWANLVKAGVGPFNAAPPQPEAVAPPATSFVTITQQQQHQANQQKSSEVHGNGTVVAGERRPPRVVTEDRRERRTSSNFNQDGPCQLFLGNLPTRATEDELRQMFSVFGKIADLRIHTKQPQKNSNNGRPVPNYGFITFEDPASATKLQEATVSEIS